MRPIPDTIPDLETDRLHLKGIDASDLPFIFQQFSDPEVTRHLYDEEPLVDMAGAQAIIDMYGQAVEKTHHRWILIRKADGVRIGTCGYHCLNVERDETDIGYDLQPAHHRQGYMCEAVEEMLAFLRDTLGVKRVNACIYPGNPGSVGLARKLGFTVAGKRSEFFRGEEIPHDLYRLVLEPPAGQAP